MNVLDASIARAAADKANSLDTKLTQLGGQIQTLAAQGAYEMPVIGTLPPEISQALRNANYRVKVSGAKDDRITVISWGN